MFDPDTPFSKRMKRSLMMTVRLCRRFIEKQLQSESNPHVIRFLKQLLKQLKDWELAVPSTPLFVLTPWLEKIQTTLISSTIWIKSLKKAENESITTLAERVSTDRVPIGQHRLPPLPYPYDALEPYIDEQTMRLHHDEHHLSYVNGLNKAERMMQEARRKGDFDLIKHWEREAAFHGAGHYLHTLFWEVMSPKGGGKPNGPLLHQIIKDFGSFASFQKHFSEAAEKVEGGGWAILVWSPRSHRLEILQAEKHQNLSQQDVIPLLPLDVWEHAYYLKYKNKRKQYIQAWWNIVNWKEVERRFNVASQVKWQPY